MRFLKIILILSQLLFLKIIASPAQMAGELISANSTYNLLLTRFKVYMDYYLMSDKVKALYDEAVRYAKSGDFEIAVIILEEALDILKDPSDSSEKDLMVSILPNPISSSNPQKLNFSLISGMDFNRQEFEVGYIEGDSTIIEEISKPYVGFSIRYQQLLGVQSSLDIQNSFRFDKESWRDDYRIRWQPFNELYLQYVGYWNQARGTDSNSYWNQVFSGRLNLPLFDAFYISLYNTFNYKSYRAGGFVLDDFYRNRFTALFEWRSFLNNTIALEYGNEFNETLGLDNNDYDQNNLRFGLRNDTNEKIFYYLSVDGAIREYAIQFDDSLIVNQFKSLNADVVYEIAISKDFRIILEDNFTYKIYNVKSSLEPDYYWNYLRPGIKLNLWGNLEFGMGYEWEFKEHLANPLDSYNVNEQNFKANGVFLLLNYFSFGGVYINTTLSYQWRRYPQSITNDLISLYSNRNIFSAMLLAYIPVSKHFYLNAFLNYDNDEDIDFDQQNNQSTIFTLEIEYMF